MKVAVLRNGCSKYSVIKQMEDSLIRALEVNHIDSFSSMLDEEGYARLYRVLEEQRLECTISINQVIGESLFSLPHILLSLDDPFWLEKETHLSPHVVACFPDEAAVSYVEQQTGKKCFYFPHACEIATYEERKKSIPFLFPASYLDDGAEYARWKMLWGEKRAQQLVDEASRYLEEPVSSYFETLETMFQVVHESTPDKTACFRSFDLFIRGYDRQRLLKSVSSENVHIVTDRKSFDLYQKRHPTLHFTYEGEKTFEELLPLLAKSQLVLQSLPTRRKGLHERTLYALSLGCLLYTTTTTALPSWLRTEGLVSYYDQKDALPTCSKQRSFFDVWKWIEQEHTWNVRVKKWFPQLLQEANEVRRIRQETDPFASLFNGL